jgi:hypothetical protein
MADDITIEVSGMDALQAELERIGGTEAKAIVKDGLNQGGEALRGAMQISTSTAFTGEPASLAAQKSSWSKSTKMGDELSGTVRVGPKGFLPDIHVSRGKGRQPLGKIYRRSLAYLIRLCEFGAQGGKERGALGRKFPMTGGFQQYKGAVLEKVISVIKEKLHL